MKKLLPILSTIGKVLQGLVLTTVFAMNLLMGYIMFAPDDLPKPFYLSYAGDLPALAASVAVAEAHTESETEHTEKQPDLIYEPGMGVMIDTGTKVVNLADPGGRRFLRATVVVEVEPPPHSAETETSAAEGEGEAAESPAVVELRNEVNQKLPIINDALNSLLTSKTFEQIYTLEGKEALRNEIKDELNKRLPDFGVITVYFTEFVVQ
jgi:flagellar FliL protein